MNEFERRLLEVSQNHVDLVELARSMGGSAQVEHFGYTVRVGSEAAPLTSGVQFTSIVPMLSDAWFVMQYVSSCVVKPDMPQWFGDSGNITLQVTDTGSGEILYSSPSSAGVATATVSRGQTGIPLLLPIPRVLPPNTNIKVDVTQMGAVAGNLEPVGFWIFFGGSRVAQV